MMGGLAYMTGLPDRPLRAGLLGGRHHGRHLRRGRHPRRAARARIDRPGHARDQRALRKHRLPRRAAHGAVRAHRRGAAADVGEAPGLGRLRHLRDRGRRPPVRRRRHRHPVAGVLPRVRLERACRRSPPQDQRHAGEGARMARPADQRDHASSIRRTSSPPSSRRSACRSRRSPSPGTCSTIRTSTPRAACWRPASTGKTIRVPALPIALDGERLASAPTRRAVGEHGAGIARRARLFTRRKSKACATAV